MHSLRRAALRSAISASRAAAVKPHTTSFAAQWTRAIETPYVSVLANSRWFSHTARIANDVEDVADKKIIDEAVQSVSEGEASPEESQRFDSEGVDSSAGSKKKEDSHLETPYGLFVRNMVFEANESHLKEAFEKYGEVAHTSIARDGRGLSKGFGFVWFTKEDAMKTAIAEADGSFWHGRRIMVAPRVKTLSRMSNPRSVPSQSIFIGNIPYETTDSELNRLFSELENVTDVRVAVDRTTGWPRGFAHADFADVESSQRAMARLQNMTLGGRRLRLDFAEGNSRRKRPQLSDTPPEFTAES